MYGSNLLGIGLPGFRWSQKWKVGERFSKEYERFFTEAGSSGNAIEIKPVDREAFLQARANYYTGRGLDTNGLPQPEKAGELGLELHAETH